MVPKFVSSLSIRVHISHAPTHVNKHKQAMFSLTLTPPARIKWQTAFVCKVCGTLSTFNTSVGPTGLPHPSGSNRHQYSIRDHRYWWTRCFPPKACRPQEHAETAMYRSAGTSGRLWSHAHICRTKAAISCWHPGMVSWREHVVLRVRGQPYYL